MRRITLALALVGAVTAAGCSGGATSTSGGNEGVAENTFKVTIQNGQNGNTTLAITGGWVTSSPAGIDCGVAPHNACEFSFPAGTPVTLTATPAAGNAFYGFAGDCHTTGACTFTGYYADKYVLAQFGVPGGGMGHPPWLISTGPRLHADQAETLLSTVPFSSSYAFPCASCHGASLTGAGLAINCAGCHAGSATAVAPALAKGETCVGCHATQGDVHQAQYNKYADAPTLVAAIESVATTASATPGKFKTVVTFNLKKGGLAYGDATLSTLGQKRYMGLRYNSATKTFDTAGALTFGTLKSLGSGRYTVEIAAAAYDVTAVNGLVYFYFSEKATIIPPAGHYALYEDVASVAQKFGTWTWTSPANSADCEKCHGAPYQKHGYRAGFVAGLDDMVPCKACHTDQRVGTHPDWQCLAEDPAAYAAGACASLPQWSSYAYVATTMNDTHMSHAMEFAYPADMANCVTCHSGKLANILKDELFVTATCKSCHPVTATAAALDPHRAPPLNPAGAVGSALPGYHTIDRATGLVSGRACNACHADAVCGYDAVTHAPVACAVGDPAATNGTGPTFCFGGPGVNCEYVPLFKEIHNGYNHQIYKADGTRYSAAITTSIASSSWNGATKVLTVNFSVAGPSSTAAIIKPTVVGSLYGYDTKDFIVGGHGTNADGKRNLEWADGASGNSPRLTVVSAGTHTWTATFDLSSWSTMIANREVKRAEIGVLPAIGVDQLAAPSSTTNPYLAVKGLSQTFDIATGTFLADGAVYGKDIVDTGKCNKCHEALAVTFHNANYGSAGVVGCRLCHIVGSGGSHLPMQSRSIDSYVHSIHSMQPFDPGDINWADPVAVLRYEHHIASTYPNFTTLNCLSCHNAGKFNTPDQTKSLPGVLSANDPGMPFVIPSVVTGPGARACGGCHRAALINAGDVAGMAAFDGHTQAFGYREPSTSLMTTIDALFCDLTEICP